MTGTPVIQVDGLTKRFGQVTAVNNVTLSVTENKIYGLLGRNGAGKTTLMQLLTGQEFATSGSIRVWGEHPVENAHVLSRVSFIKESQKYPDDFKVKHVFRSAPWFFAGWDADFAARLIEDFRVPLDRRVKKLSRGQLSAIGVIAGLASRAPITFFDEPYLGLDAVARQTFYDRLLADYAEYPRTVILSTHLIDEVSALLEHVLVIDEGRILIDEDAETLRGSATTIVGARAAVDGFVADRDVLHRSGLGGLSTVTVTGLSESDRAAAAAAGLELAPVSLQQLVVDRTSGIPTELEQSA
ncbi:ABC transporter ATP-binding protein [Klugiella xanthotipulae]|uniref:ABC-2 type transport system ATP-binding protein n=1 Tax=Klugiella xanthotipulae TaxID=244735 RepID=A0A543I5V1_9MICO|nr:ABC transporter ATP-binding protein [Klugiella xanthotipulae]TQM65921.1 ABC-2 type transport system ATP-binding protein [Klugiella xanthotipulae]